MMGAAEPMGLRTPQEVAERVCEPQQVRSVALNPSSAGIGVQSRRGAAKIRKELAQQSERVLEVGLFNDAGCEAQGERFGVGRDAHGRDFEQFLFEITPPEARALALAPLLIGWQRADAPDRAVLGAV